MSVEWYEHGQAVVHHRVGVDKAGWDESQQPHSRKPLCVPVLPDRPCLHHLASGWRRRERMCELNEVMTTSIMKGTKVQTLGVRAVAGVCMVHG